MIAIWAQLVLVRAVVWLTAAAIPLAGLPAGACVCAGEHIATAELNEHACGCSEASENCCENNGQSVCCSAENADHQATICRCDHQQPPVQAPWGDSFSHHSPSAAALAPSLDGVAPSNMLASEVRLDSAALAFTSLERCVSLSRLTL